MVICRSDWRIRTAAGTGANGSIGGQLMRELGADALAITRADVTGVIRGPAGSGLVSTIADPDVVDVATTVLPDPAHSGATYDLTGPEALSVTDVAACLSRVSGRDALAFDHFLAENPSTWAHLLR